MTDSDSAEAIMAQTRAMIALLRAQLQASDDMARRYDLARDADTAQPHPHPPQDPNAAQRPVP